MDVATFKQTSRSTWAAGNYDIVAERILSAGERLVSRLGVRKEEDVLDVACGTGNATIPAARAGARVVGADLTPELFDAARRRAVDAGVEVDWVEADAEALPFDDESFDVVLSTFGCMFAPRHELAAREIGRVLRPGGRVGVASWTPEGVIGDFFAAVGAHLPPPPSFASPPILWGTPDHVRSVFAGTGVELSFELDSVDFHFGSVREAVDFYVTNFGPLVKTRQRLESQGLWAVAHRDLVAHYEEHVREDGSLAYAGEYLVAIGRKS
jgi:ubiquinone/menaquinone biosynthesis C-methylase UbiE